MNYKDLIVIYILIKNDNISFRKNDVKWYLKQILLKC